MQNRCIRARFDSIDQGGFFSKQGFAHRDGELLPGGTAQNESQSRGTWTGEKKKAWDGTARKLNVAGRDKRWRSVLKY